jgi:hypothetical protein
VTAIVKQDDVGVTFTDALTVSGAPVNLTGVTVAFVMRCGTTAISAAATVTNAATGAVRYVTVAGDLAKAGVYRQEWQATFPSGQVITFPSDEYNEVRVLSDLN